MALQARREELDAVRAEMRRHPLPKDWTPKISRRIPMPPEAMEGVGPTLAEGLAKARAQWQGQRSFSRNVQQAMGAIEVLETLGCTHVSDVTKRRVAQLRDISLAVGLAPATIQIRLSGLSVMGVSARVQVRIRRQPRWYLKADDEARIGEVPGLDPRARAFIRWTCATGLRVEESLRLQRCHVDVSGRVLAVPGTKNANALRNIRLSNEAISILEGLEPNTKAPGDPIFSIGYKRLSAEWQKVRRFLDVEDIPTATLKALRRLLASPRRPQEHAASHADVLSRARGP